ncbi:MAG: hypothetical protein JJT95_00070 [Pararhodobacter sp.]|nr:hypothetical protein [Pararhodobacter sp.]
MRLVIPIVATLALAACEYGPPTYDSPRDTRISPPSGEVRPREPRIVPPSNDQQPRRRPPRGPRNGPSDDPDACGASRYQHLVGERLPEPFPARGVVRIFRTGDPVTMDHSPSRLNVETERRRDRIVRIFCG